MIKGLDNGYMYTKDNDKRIFKSAYTQVEDAISGSHHININGQDYYVGHGNSTVDVDKTQSDINKVCTLTNLSMSEDNTFYLVAGLPIEQYLSQKDKLAESIMSYNQSEIRYDNFPTFIKINDVTVYPKVCCFIFYG